MVDFGDGVRGGWDGCEWGLRIADPRSLEGMILTRKFFIKRHLDAMDAAAEYDQAKPYFCQHLSI